MGAPGHSAVSTSFNERRKARAVPGPGTYDPTIGEKAIKVRPVARDVVDQRTDLTVHMGLRAAL